MNYTRYNIIGESYLHGESICEILITTKPTTGRRVKLR